jgi:hypothetical protein
MGLLACCMILFCSWRLTRSGFGFSVDCRSIAAELVSYSANSISPLLSEL